MRREKVVSSLKRSCSGTPIPDNGSSRALLIKALIRSIFFALPLRDQYSRSLLARSVMKTEVNLALATNELTYASLKL